MCLARKIWGPGRTTEEQVKVVVKACSQCASINPAPLQWDKGKLCVKKTWQRVAVDVVHMGTLKFLFIIDCGLGRFTVWWRIG